MARPALILVTGPPGSGKTTLARQLARAIGCPAISRDEIKEGMAASTPDFVPAVDDPLTRRTYAVFFDLLRLLAAAEVTVVAEAAFQHRRWQQGLEPLSGLAELRVIRCRLEPAAAQARIRARLADPTRAAHPDASMLGPPASFAEPELGVPSLDVDTSDGYRPLLAEIVSFARGAGMEY